MPSTLTHRWLRHMTKVVSLSPSEARARHADGSAYLVDVREANEWKLGHAPGALLLPLSTMTESRLRELPQDKPIIFYCKAGARSAQALDLCRKLGLPHDHHIEGGITAWAHHGLPIEQ